MTHYGIGDLARESGATLRAIRFYEDHGLLRPLREGQRRIYRERDRTRLKLILRGKRLGFSLAEIAEILALYDEPRGEARQLAFLLEKIAVRRAELLAKQRDIEASLRDLEDVARDCRRRQRALKDGARKPEQEQASRRRPGRRASR